MIDDSQETELESEVAENSEELEDQETESIESDDSEESQSSEPEDLHKITVDGKEIELSYDELVKSAQLDKASYKRMEEASKLQKQMEPLLDVLRRAKAGDVSVIKQLGIPSDALRKFSEDELLAHIQEEEMSEEERRAVIAERERDKLAEEKKRAEANQFKMYQQHLEAEAAKKIQDEIQSAFKDAGIPLKGNQRLVARVCEDKLRSSESGSPRTMRESLDASLQQLEKEYAEYARMNFEKDPDAFIANLPDSIANGVRKRSLDQVGSRIPMGKSLGKDKKSGKVEDDFKKYMRREMLRG